MTTKVVPQASLGWTHLELGGANYGVDGHSKGEVKGGHSNQFRPLFATVDHLVTSQGSRGTFYINDLEQSHCDYAAGKLKGYIASKYPNSKIRVFTLAKSYREIDIPADCGVEQATSVHLKNPDKGQYVEDCRLQDQTGWMENVAKCSKTGLRIIHYYDSSVKPPMSTSRAGEKTFQLLRYDKVPLRQTLDGQDYVYVNPDGRTDPLWSFLSYNYTFRVRNERETLTPAEEAKLLGVQSELTQILETKHAREVERAEELQAQISSAGVAPLFKVFYVKKEDQLDVSNVRKILIDPISKRDFSRQISALSIDDLEGESAYVRGTLTDPRYDPSFNQKAAGLSRKLAQFTKLKLRDVASVDDLNFEHSLRQVQARGLGLRAHFDRIGLGDAFTSRFASDAEFWSLDQTAREVYFELREAQATLDSGVLRLQDSSKGDRIASTSGEDLSSETSNTPSVENCCVLQ